MLGSVSVPNSKDSTAEYRIRDANTIIRVILPIFDKHTLLTSKQFHYINFRKALVTYTNSNLSFDEKDKLLTHLKNSKLPSNYQSPAWHDIDCTNIHMNIPKVQSIMAKEWLIGFTEAEGSFYLLKKSPSRMVHVFEITQKQDKIVLVAISIVLSIKVIEKKTYNTCLTTNRKSVNEVIDYFKNTMKGIKSLEYRI